MADGARGQATIGQYDSDASPTGKGIASPRSDGNLIRPESRNRFLPESLRVYGFGRIDHKGEKTPREFRPQTGAIAQVAADTAA